MSRIEKRLWIIWTLVCVMSLAVSYALSWQGGVEFPSSPVFKLRRALRPDRDPRKIEQASSVAGIQTIHVSTSSTSLRVGRSEDLVDLSMSLEGRFLKTTERPLTYAREGDVLNIRVDEGLMPLPWTSPFDDENRNSVLTLVIPRNYAGRLVIETVSGITGLEKLSLSGLEWSSVSGELQSHSGEIHVVRLKSVSGNLDFDGRTQDLSVNLTSGNAHVALHGIENVVGAKIDAQSVSGRIDLSVPEASSFRIAISSFTGEATSTVDVKRSMQSAGAYEGVLGAGEGELRLRSVSGNVRLTTQ